MTEHTPGPWVFKRGHIGQAHGAYTENGQMVAFVPRMDQEADAHLIAAAPDLLEALEGLLGCDHECDGLHVRMALAAIAKARGEAS